MNTHSRKTFAKKERGLQTASLCECESYSVVEAGLSHAPSVSVSIRGYFISGNGSCRRASMDNGQFLGTREMGAAKIWLNTQTWSVLSRRADRDKAVRVMESVKALLDTDPGNKKIHPPIVNFPSLKDLLTHYNPVRGDVPRGRGAT